MSILLLTQSRIFSNSTKCTGDEKTIHGSSWEKSNFGAIDQGLSVESLAVRIERMQKHYATSSLVCSGTQCRLFNKMSSIG